MTGVEGPVQRQAAYLNEHPEFREIGGRMLAEWNEGMKEMVELRSVK
jgi:hypothetical protein